MHNHIERAIMHAATASRLRYWAARDEQVARGLTKAANHHSAMATRHLDKVGDSPMRQEGEPPFTHRPSGGEGDA